MGIIPDQSPLLSFEDARHLVEAQASQITPGETELVDLLNCGGRVLAEGVTADHDFPPFRRAARDGYAVHASDVAQPKAVLEVVAEVKAGADLDQLPVIQQGQAASIMTGAPTPADADVIVMVEYTSRQGDRVEINRPPDSGANIVAVGSEAKRGQQLLIPSLQLNHKAIAVAAAVGRTHMSVYKKPIVAILSTGDEIVDVSTSPGPSQVRNSNTYSLAAQVVESGGMPLLLPIAPDEPVRLRELIAQGLEADLLLLAGGVSLGKYDLVEQVLSEFGAEFFFTGVKIQPGKPAVFGRVAYKNQTKYFFGLPGNPVSTMVTFTLFALPVLQALSGQTPANLRFLHARLSSEMKTKRGLKRFLPGLLSGELEQAEVKLAPWRGSGDIAAMVLSNCYIVIDPDRDHYSSGEWVPLLLR